MSGKTDVDPEFNAMQVVFNALKDLDADAQKRVLEYVLRRLALDTEQLSAERSGNTFSPTQLAREAEELKSESAVTTTAPAADDEFEGISSVAQRWMRRNGLSPKQLSKLFTLGVDEIDLIAKSVPGKTTKQKMRSVALLTGVAAFLGSGAARVNHQALKEALSDYNAYDVNNFASYLKDMAGEISGSKESGYTLTARGLAAAAEIISEVTASK
jgi:hypothetical protein